MQGCTPLKTIKTTHTIKEKTNKHIVVLLLQNEPYSKLQTNINNTVLAT